MINLREINEDNYRAFLNLSVYEYQESFLMSSQKALAVAYAFRNRIKMFSIYNEEDIVGFAMLRYNSEDESYFLWNFMIDKDHQRKGYGKKSLEKIIEWARTQKNCKKLVTTCSEGNDDALELYKKYNFKITNVYAGEETDLELEIV